MAGGPEASATPTFELKRFAWLTPDRLGVSGRFAGLEQPAEGEPVLVIRAGERVLRLPMAGDSRSGSTDDGEVWQAAFEWRDAPVAFDAAELERDGMVVELPELDGRRRISRRRVLEVRTAAADPVASQVALIAAEEEVREVRVATEQLEQELARARGDLKAERERRSADGERFRESLAKLSASAEEALAVEQSANRQLGSDLREAHAALEEKEATESALRARVAELERDGEETERLRTELEQAHGAVDQAREEAERLVARLTGIRAR